MPSIEEFTTQLYVHFIGLKHCETLIQFNSNDCSLRGQIPLHITLAQLVVVSRHGRICYSLRKTENITDLYRFSQSNSVLRPPGSKSLFGDQVIVGNHTGSPSAPSSGADELPGECGLSGGRQPADDAQTAGSQADSFGLLCSHEPERGRSKP